MKFGVNTLIWAVKFDPTVIPLKKLKKAGVDGIEVPVFVPQELDVAGLKAALSDYGFECTFCSVNPAGMNPIDSRKSVRKKTMTHWKRVIDTAAEVGAKLIAGPTYSPVGWLPGRRRTDQEWGWAVELHQQLGPHLAERGVEIAVEPINRFETFFLNTADDSVKFVKEIGSKQIGILLDTFHSNIEDKDVGKAYRKCGRWLKHVHACENDRGTPGSGHVDWLSVKQSLEAIKYDRWLTIESFNANMPELSAATAIWRDLAKSMDDIATQGTRFLRKTWGAG